MAFGLVIDDLRVFFVGLVVVFARRLLQFGNRIGCPHVLLAFGAPRIFATCCQFVLQHFFFTERAQMHRNGFLRHFKQTQTTDIARCACEIFIHQVFLQTNGFKNLRTCVRHIGRNTHFRHDFLQAFADRLDEILNRLRGFFVLNQTFLHHVGQGRERKVGVHRLCTVAAKQGKMMHFACRASLYHQTR